MSGEWLFFLLLSRFAKRKAKQQGCAANIWTHLALLPVYEYVLVMKKIGLLLKDLLPFYLSDTLEINIGELFTPITADCIFPEFFVHLYRIVIK